MCGIVGHFNLTGNGMTERRAKTVRELAIAGTVRGYDGTGFFYQNALSGKTFYKKGPVTAAEVTSKDGWVTSLRDARFVVVHNRAATLGAIDEDNTHPFIFEHITGVHNGTINAWRYAWPDVEATMDSMALFEGMSKVDSDHETTAQFLENIPWSGAYSLVWYDSRAEELRFARNDERPMHLITSDDGIWFGSELGMFEWILSRNHTNIWNAVSLDPGKLLCLPIKGGEGSVHGYNIDSFSRSSVTYGSSYPYTTHVADAWETERWNSVGTGNNNNQRALYASTHPDISGKFIDVVNYSSLPSHLLDINDELKEGIRTYCGVDIDFYTVGSSVENDITANILSRYESVERPSDDITICFSDNAAGQRCKVKVNIVDFCDESQTAMGYTDLGDELAPVSVRIWNTADADFIEDALDEGVEVVTYPLSYRGVRVYHTGEVVPLLAAIYSNTGGVLMKGEPMNPQLKAGFGADGNPYAKAFKITPEWRLNWSNVATENKA